MLWLFLGLIYLVFALQVWRHVGWWARRNHSICLCTSGKHYNRSDRCHGMAQRCYRCGNPCAISGLWDYSWTLAFSIAFGWLIVACWGTRSLSMKYGLTEKSIGFFTPSPLVESREDKITRLEQEAVERNAYIRKMEIENGIGA